MGWNHSRDEAGESKVLVVGRRGILGAQLVPGNAFLGVDQLTTNLRPRPIMQEDDPQLLA